MADFTEILKKFDMIAPDGRGTPGLVFVGDKDKRKTPHEIIALEHAAKYKADAVYFKHFEGGRPPIPQIYIYDWTLNAKSDQGLAELHNRLWSFASIPLFFVFSKTEVKFFNCLKQPKLDENTGKFTLTIFEKIKIASNIKKEIEKIKSFSSKKFDNGSFWHDPKYKDEFKIKESVYIKLLKQLKQTRNNIIKKKILSEKVADKLLVMSILLKYLEERRDENGDTVFPPGFFSRFSGHREKDTFMDVLRTKGACLDLFDDLSSKDRFNGEIFRWNDIKERDELKLADLNEFVGFLEGKIRDSQYTIFRLYSFNDLPVELISNIYEQFLESKPGVVYTPPYLVNFLLDESMPITDFDKVDFKVLDPACGSGVFLVAAYRRMINWWRIRNNWKKPGADDLDELKLILKNNIFGVDKHEEAVHLTFFSLSLALLDELSPKVIWENLKFDNLMGKNLVSRDFFKLINNDFFQPDFDLVIGNPPFIPKLTDDAQEIENRQIKIRPKLPDNQIALLFLEQGINLCKPNSLLCLIMPAGPFLYNSNSVEFRKYFLETFHIPQIIDFTFLSDILFAESSKKPAVAAVFAKKEDSGKKDLLHVAVRRTKPVKEKIYFELDHYDFHRVSFHESINSRLIWKSNLLGGGRLKHLMSKFGCMRSLGDYLDEKKKSEGWKIAEGYIIGNKDKINELIELKSRKNLTTNGKERLKYLEKRYKTADYLTEKRTIPTEAFTEKGIDENQIYTLRQKYFLRNREKNKEIFKAPHLLIKEIVGANSIPVVFLDYDLSFRSDIIGIHTLEEQLDELKEIERRIKNNNKYLFLLAGLSGRYMVGRVTSIIKHDILSLPYPENEKEIELSAFEQILVDDVLDYMLDFRRKGENSKTEKNVTDEQLNQFSEIYCKVLNSVYKKFKPHEPFKTASFICFPFYYEHKPQIPTNSIAELEPYLDKLIQNNIGENSRIVRIFRIYENNTIYLFKPNQTRYWLRSVAIRDADETFADLVDQGY